MRREVHSSHRLIITPDVHRGSSHDATRALLDDMAAQVRRHIDHIAMVKAEWDTKTVCSHCNTEWETLTAADVAAYPGDYDGFVVGEPMCCDKASAEFRAEQAKTGGA